MASKWFTLKIKFVKLLVSDKALAEQARQPSGWLGKNILKPMFITGNAALNQLIFDLLEVKPKQKLLEIGFGPGVLINQLCTHEPLCKIIGLDFSPMMVKQASLLNRRHIKSYQLALIEGNSDCIPVEYDSFDSIFCANTLYFWQPPEPHINEIFRVLNSGGKFVMGFRTGDQIDEMALHPTIFARYSKECVQVLLETAGFINVEIKEQEGFPVDSICVVASKP
ncbi:MAG: hypothetical protein ISEC1_P0959 [Thiomicrorhabdus sp.]|nr:MAG: hypothetical protein ISEC1_P0959 [Thiomicrorhabdus sp.]